MSSAREKFGVSSTSLNLSEPSCSSPDVSLGSGVATVVINGAIGQSNTLDLSSASGTLAVNMATTPEAVTGLTMGAVSTVDFSNVLSVLGPTAGNADFVAGSASAAFTGQGSNNTLDLSALAASSGSPVKINFSGGPVNGQPNDTVVDGSTTYLANGIGRSRPPPNTCASAIALLRPPERPHGRRRAADGLPAGGRHPRRV